MKPSQIVTFVVDRELDITNHFIGVNNYKQKKERGIVQNNAKTLERLSNLSSRDEVRSEIEKIIEPYYKKEEKLATLAQDINEEWSKIEIDFIARLEKIHKFPFPYKSVKGVLSSAGRFGYDTNDGWFAASMFKNKFMAIDTATHELMHFMFHKYYDHVCVEAGLSKDQMWDVKESFTVLLNAEFDDLRFEFDGGYPINEKIREVIKTSWEKEPDFGIALNKAIEFVKS